MAPPTTEQKQLLGVPNEILDHIVLSSVEDGVHVKASNESGKSTLAWEPAWVPALLLVHPQIKAGAEPIIARAAQLEVSECKRGPEMLAKEYDPDEEINTPQHLDHFPAYLTNGAKSLIIQQSKVACQFKTDTIDLSVFPQLQNLEMSMGNIS